MHGITVNAFAFYLTSIANYNHSMGYAIYDNIVVTAKTTNWN